MGPWQTVHSLASIWRKARICRERSAVVIVPLFAILSYASAMSMGRVESRPWLIYRLPIDNPQPI